MSLFRLRSADDTSLSDLINMSKSQNSILEMKMLYLYKKDDIDRNKLCILLQISIAPVETVEQGWREIARYNEDRWWLDQISYCSHLQSINWCAGSYLAGSSHLCSQSGREMDDGPQLQRQATPLGEQKCHKFSLYVQMTLSNGTWTGELAFSFMFSLLL